MPRTSRIRTVLPEAYPQACRADLQYGSQAQAQQAARWEVLDEESRKPGLQRVPIGALTRVRGLLRRDSDKRYHLQPTRQTRFHLLAPQTEYRSSLFATRIRMQQPT